ncbi:MAG TPA: hypothetical protein VGJ84_05240 [Polyangiaceae bacterium]|jgi:hypothetical protein
MRTDSIVVMDVGSEWPSWVDEGGSQESNVAVISRQEGECGDEFACRARAWLTRVAEVFRPECGVVVTGGEAPTWVSAILEALASVLVSSGGDSLILVSAGGHAQQRELAHVVRALGRELELSGREISLQFRVAVSEDRSQDMVAA